jgi:uncharacterized protein (DUF983 family)
MSKSQNACCPQCGESISFKKFVLLNNFSATNCSHCNTRMEISNRNANAVIAGISGCISAACIVLCTWYGQAVHQSFLGGLLTGLGIAVLLIGFICWYAYTHSKLNKINTEYRITTMRMIEG